MPCRANTADRVLCKGPYGRSAAKTRRSIPRPSHSNDASTRRLGAIDSRRLVMVVSPRIVGSKPWPLQSVNLLAERQSRLRARPGHGKCGCPGGPSRGFGKRAALRESDGQSPVEGVASPDGVNGLDTWRRDVVNLLVLRDQATFRPECDHDSPGP